MSDINTSPRKALPQGTAQPSCPNCQVFMDMVPMLTGLAHLANRIFRCGRCGEIEVLPEASIH